MGSCAVARYVARHHVVLLVVFLSCSMSSSTNPESDVSGSNLTSFATGRRPRAGDGWLIPLEAAKSTACLQTCKCHLRMKLQKMKTA